MELATLCYIRDSGKTLMLHRNKRDDDMHEGFYVGLGGKFQPGESPEECVIREVQEESGLTIKPEFKGILTFANEERSFNGKKRPDYYVFVYTSSEYSGNMKSGREGELEWILDEEVNGLPMWEGDRIFTDWIYEDKVFSAKFKYVDDKLEDYNVEFYPSNRRSP